MTINLNPSAKTCWSTCGACYRCKDKGRYTACGKCSGRHDPFLQTDVDPDDFCSCTEGILRWRSKAGQLIVRKYKSNPFESKVISESKTEDEQEWDAYVHDLREKFDDPNYDPITVNDQSSTNYFKQSGY